MADAARDDEHLIGPQPNDTDRLAVALDVIGSLAQTIRALKAENFRIIADKAAAARDAPPQVWLALKPAAAAVGVAYQNVLGWCTHGVIVAEKRFGRWFVRMDSLQAHVAALRGK